MELKGGYGLTLRDILNEAQQNIGTPISDRDFIRHYNKCLHDLSMVYDSAKAITTQTIVCEDTTTFYPLTVDIIGVRKVETPEGYNISTFKVQDGAIRFLWKGSYTVHEFILHTPIIGLNGTITINTSYLRAIVIYISAHMIKKSDKDNFKELMLEFNELAGLANSNIRKNTNKYKKVATRPFR